MYRYICLPLKALLAALLLFVQVLPVYALDTTFDVKLSPPLAGQGTSIGSKVAVGDINGDGMDDVIVGDSVMSPPVVYIYYGTLTGPSTTVSKTLSEVDASASFGEAVATGDINNDGYDDVLVGARSYNSNTGRVYVFFGGADMNTDVDVTLTGETTSNRFGDILSSGDVNNDGYDDVIVGAPLYSSNTGRAYVFFGGSSMDTTADVTMTGDALSAFGQSVANADVNNDGYDDVLIGAWNALDNGQAYVFLGGSSMDNVVDITMTGENSGDQFGINVSSAGDVNNDGYEDVLVGAHRYNGSTGRAYIFLGSSSMNNVVDVTLTGENSGDVFGFTLGSAGDINNDGYDDVLVGAFQYPGELADGRGYLFYGGSSMNSVVDVTFDAPTAGIGLSISAVGGDFNGDVTADVVLGAYQDDAGDGSVYVYLGTDITKPQVSALSPLDDATDVSSTDNLSITFNERVQGGTGTLLIKKSSDDSTVETITTNGGLMTGSGSRVITIDPATTLDANTSYYITIHPNTFRDRVGNFFAGLSASTTWNFTTAAAASSSSSSESSSSSSLSAEERQGSGGGRGAGSTTRVSPIVQKAIQERFSTKTPNVTTPHPASAEQETILRHVPPQRQAIIRRLLDRREQRRQLRLKRVGGR